MEVIITNSIIALLFSYLLFSVRKMSNKIDKSVSEEKVRIVIDDKIEPLKIRDQDLKETLGRLERNVDKLLDIITRS